LLGFLTVGLTFLRAVDAVEADTFGAVVVQDFDGVAVEDGDDEAVGSVRETRSPELIGRPSIR
jgi:hypothetical protein